MQIPRSIFSLASFALVLTTLHAPMFADAVECTVSDFEKVEESTSSATNSTRRSCLSRLTEDSYCKDTECLDLASSLVGSIGNCTISGYTLDEVMTKVLEFCDNLNNQATGSATDDTTDDSTADMSAASSFVDVGITTWSLAVGISASLLAADL